ALERSLGKLDKVRSKRTAQATAARKKASASLAKSRKAGRAAAVDSAAVVGDLGFGAINGVISGFQGVKGVGFSLAGGAGRVAEGVREGLASAMVSMAKELGRGATALDGRQFTVRELLADPNATTWSQRMFTTSFVEFTKAGLSLRAALMDFAAAA